MAALVIPNAVLVRLVWTSAAGGTPVNVIGFRKTGAVTVNQALADTVSATIKANFTSSGYAGFVTTSNGLVSVGVRDLSQPNLPEFIGAGAKVSGTQPAGKVLPSQVALCITLRTAKAGKSYRGRTYLPQWGDSALDAGGFVATAANTAGIAFMNENKTDLPANGLTMAVISRKTASFEDVTLVQSRDQIWDTIRGRGAP